MSQNKLNAPDLTQRPPRSPRVRIGGYALLARCIDKGRATIAGKTGEYHFNCPLDQHLFKFTGIKADALKKQLAAGKGDGEIVAWINETGTKHAPWEIIQWSDYQEKRSPGSVETHEYFTGMAKRASATRDDISTWFEVLDLDDHVTFGGKA